MSYLKSDRSTLTADASSTVDIGTPHIIPGVLYPAWSGLLTDNTAYTFTDSSASAHVITPVGDMFHSGVKKKVGSTSLGFDGTDDILHWGADHADFQFGSGDFTIEMWFNLAGSPVGVASGDAYIGPSSLDWGSNDGFRCIVDSGTPRAKFNTTINSR